MATTDLKAELARIGVTGGITVADVGTVMPAGLEPYGLGFAGLGFISDDGLTESPDEDSETFTAWQSNSPIRVQITRSAKIFKFTCWETNWQTISLYYRVKAADVTVGSGPSLGVISFDEKSKPRRDTRAFGFDVVDGDYARRALLPYAEVTKRGDLIYKSNAIIGYPLEVTAYPGPDGISVKRVFKEGWAVPA